MANGRAVDAHFVGPGIQQPAYVGQLVDAASHREGDVDFACHAGNHVGEGLALFERGRDVEEHQLVGSLPAIGFSQFNRVACAAQIDEVNAFYRLAVLDV